jgi:uncharacterized membrane protein
VSSTSSPSGRLYAIDALRGIVMLLMALDHCRDYYGDIRLDPVDLATTTPALFFTRWVTHVCAPVFVLLAGTAAWLSGASAGPAPPRASVSRFLLVRGVWLIVIEFTVVHFAWTNSFLIGVWFLGVIAAIGIAMIALAGLVLLPRPALLAVALVLTAGHNVLDPIASTDLGSAGWLWILAHDGSLGRRLTPIFLAEPGPALLVIYPVLPWIGVMALGYFLGPICARPRLERRRILLGSGLVVTAAFVGLRWANGYGDPEPWTVQGTGLMTLASFLNCEKYPPSLAYLLMTLGPALVLLGALDREPGRFGRVLVTIGRVPLFYYVAHLYLIHLSSRAFYALRYGEALSSFTHRLRTFQGTASWPEWYGQDLWMVYASWVVVVLVLYPACVRYADLKRRSRSPILRYL